MKKNATRKALFSSVLALVLCFSMLMSTTFAWFTDSAASANNIIQPGNLDVKLEYWDGDSYEEVAPTQKLFDEAALWEPGHVEVAYLKVSNAGSLALKYQLNVNVFKETVGKTMDGADLKLSDHLVFSVIDKEITSADDVYSREAAMLAAGNAKGLKAYNGETKSLTVGGSDYVALVIYMPTGVGNEANHDGINLPSIEMGVNVLATQFTYEEDSFGPDYDKDAWADGFKVHDANDLQTAINNGEKNIVVMDNIVIDETITISAPATTYRLRSLPNATIIDLNGKTVTGNLHKNDGAVIKNDGILVLKNGTVSSLGNNGGSAIVNNGNLLVEDVVLNGAPNADGSWPSYTVNNTGVMTANNAKITSYHGAVASYGEGALVTLNNSEIDMAGIPGFTSHGIYTYNNGAVIVNGGVYANKATDQASSGASVINGAVTVNAGTFTGRIENYYGTPVIKGGSYTENPTKYLAEGFETAKDANGVYGVSFPQDSFDSLIDNAVAGDVVEVPAGTYTFPASDLKAGVTLNCAPGTVFAGNSELNINGATVIGATFSNPTGTAADQTVNGVFKNCVFEGANGLRWCYAGDVVVFENCVFSGSTYGVHFDGGANEVIFRGCTFSGFNALGGEIKNATIENCTFKSNGKSNYNGINLWGSADLVDCTFIFDGTAGYEWVDLVGSNIEVNFTNCVVTDGTNTKEIETVIGNYGTGNKVTVDGVQVVYSADELSAAVNAGEMTIMLADGQYDLNGIQKDGLTLIGVGNDVKVANTTKYASGKAVGAIWKAINLENLTITNTVYTMADGGNATFTGVYFAGGMRQCYGTGVVFTDCTFGSNSEGFALHFQTDSVSEGGLIKLDGCTFEGGKVHLGGKRAYEFTDCDFAAGTDFQVWSNITLEDCTVNGETVTAENMATLFPNLNAEKVTIK